MLAVPCQNEARRRCSQCGAVTDRLGTDPVSGAVDIPLCPSCARGDLRRVFVLLLALGIAVVWAI
jgi:hypothetical protein